MSNRKYNLTCALLLVNLGLLIAERITSEMWMNLCMFVLSAYIVGNVIQKMGVKTDGQS